MVYNAVAALNPQRICNLPLWGKIATFFLSNGKVPKYVIITPTGHSYNSKK